MELTFFGPIVNDKYFVILHFVLVFFFLIFYDSCRFRLIILSYFEWDELLCLELLYTVFFVGFFFANFK